jgi:hypothetical protein
MAKEFTVTDEINSEKTETAMTEEKQGGIFFTMLSGKTVKETVSTSRGDFVVKFPKQNDMITIARLAAFMRAGIPAGNFDASGDYEIQKCATLDVIVDSGPAWYNKAKKNPDFSWRNMPDAYFVDEVYAKALSFRQTVQAELRGIEGVANTGDAKEAPESVPKDVGGGLFSGIAGTIKRGRSKRTGSGV